MIASYSVIIFMVLSFQLEAIKADKLNDAKQTATNNKNDLNEYTTQLKDTLQSIKSNDVDETQDDPSDDFDVIDDDLLETPITDIDFDNLNNALIIKFSKDFIKFSDPSDTINVNDKQLDEPIILRYTRDGHDNLMRFGKRNFDSSKDDEAVNSLKSSSRYGRSSSTTRDSRGDNFMRFGRAKNNNNNGYMRFGRASSNNMMRFGRSNGNNLMRFGRSNSMMRFGRSNSNLMRFGRSNLMRFGRADPNLMRFGRSNSNFMRFGRSDPRRTDNFIRFGRNQNNLMRFGRNDRNFMRFGKLDQNFMRFGKRDEIFKGSHLDADTTSKGNDNENQSNTEHQWDKTMIEPDTNSDSFGLNENVNDYDRITKNF